MSNQGFRIYLNGKRTDINIADKFYPHATPNIADNMNRMFCMDSTINPVRDDLKLVGVALTVKTRPGDNLLVHKAIDLAQRGDVIVIDAQGDMTNSILGEIMVRYAMKRGIRGFIVDGAIRDLAALKKLDFPVYAKGCTPRGPYKDGPGEINVPISCGGVVVSPGDIIVGDGDGVVIIPPSEANEILKKTEQIALKEEEIFQQIEEGVYDRSWVDNTLTQKQCEIIK